MTESQPGPLAEEAAKLIGAAQEWLHRVAGDPATARIANDSPECCWCPLCQLIVTLRGGRPELTERLADTQAALAGLLRALADVPLSEHRPRNEGGAERSDKPAGAPAGQPAGPARVHRIDLDDA